MEAITGGRVKLQLGPENWNAVGEAIMDQLAEAGVVGPEEGTKPRKVLMTSAEFEQYIEETIS